MSASAQDEATILVAEDNPDDLFLLRYVLETLGIKQGLRVVRDGLGVIQYLKGEPPYEDRLKFPIPRVILLDWRMPGVSGEEVQRWIRSQPAFREMGVVVLSGCPVWPDSRDAFEAGGDFFFSKPSDLEEYGATLKPILALWLGPRAAIKGGALEMPHDAGILYA